MGKESLNGWERRRMEISFVKHMKIMEFKFPRV